MNGKTIKTVEVTPTWEAALNICVWALENSLADLRSQHAKNALQHRINAMRDTFLPLCRTVDQRNEEVRKEREAAEVLDDEETVRKIQDECEHREVNADFHCSVCGADRSHG